jgi:O-acetylhomoserine (thiol)-lyase
LLFILAQLSVLIADEEKRIAGVYDDLVRISVGIEDVEDLIEDFTQAVEFIQHA